MITGPSLKKLPAGITSYDLLKTLALVLMIVDHVSLYFFPDYLWLRIAGRLTVPIWFFLIGYARTRDVPQLIWIGGLILTISGPLAGLPLFPMNILITLGLTRLVIDKVMVRALRKREALAGMGLLLFFFSFPTGLAVEYGTLGVLFAVLGYLRRHKDELTVTPLFTGLFTLGCVAALVIAHWPLIPSITLFQLSVFGTGAVLIFGLLLAFRPVEWSGLPGLNQLFNLFGRYTLEIYLLHVLAFRVLAVILYPDRFSASDFTLFPASQLGLFFF